MVDERIPLSYEAKDIQVLEGLEAVRRRPGMYVGGTDIKALHHLVYEVVDNSIDEALAGYADDIHVEILPGNVIRVTDNGRGIPVDIHPKTKRPSVETVYTVLHAGGKFDHNSYKVSGGLHGVGASVVNALSSYMIIEIHKDGKQYIIEFDHGFVKKELECLGDTEKSGTIVTFLADPLVFTESQEYEYETLRSRIQQLAFLNKGIKFCITDSRNEANVIRKEYRYEGGVREYVEFLNSGKSVLHPMVAYFEGEQEGITVEIAMQYNDGYAANIYPFTNNITNPEGGTHEEGFKMTLTRILNMNAPVTIPANKPEEKRTFVFGIKIYKKVNRNHISVYGSNPKSRKTIELKLPNTVNFSMMRLTWVVIKTVMPLERMSTTGHTSMSER